MCDENIGRCVQSSDCLHAYVGELICVIGKRGWGAVRLLEPVSLDPWIMSPHRGLVMGRRCSFMAMLCHMPNLAVLIAPERDSVSDSCHEAAPREPWGYEGYMSGGLIGRGIIVLVCDSRYLCVLVPFMVI